MYTASRNKGGRPATIADVASRAGVSAMTVSRVINGKGNVKPETVRKIEEAIATVNYRPNVGARRLSGGKTYQFLLLFDNPNTAWIGEVLIGMMHACHDVGYHLMIEGVGEHEGENSGTPIDYDEIWDLVDLSRVDGVILPPPICFDRQLLDITREKKVPCVRIANTPARDIRLRVGIDNFAGAYDIGEHLVALGHTRLAIIKGPDNFVASGLRYEGFATAVREHGLNLPEANVKLGHFDGESGYECARELLRLPDCPTAIFASNDEMAAGVLAAAREARIEVPDQLSVAGFDDAPIARAVWPRLTTIRQPLRLMGESAVKLLDTYIRQVDAGTSDTLRPDVLLGYELITRQSTASPPR